MKATGLGFGLALDDFCIILNGDSIRVEQSVDDRHYYFKEYPADRRYKFSVCLADKTPDDNEPYRIRFTEMRK